MSATNYIWNFMNDTIAMEKDDAGNTTAVYTNEPDEFGGLISQRRNGVTSHYHYDGQHSTRMLTDDSQAVTDTYTYTAFGESVATTGSTANPFRYVGEFGYYFDGESDSYQVRRRGYEPATARWQSYDPQLWTVPTRPFKGVHPSSWPDERHTGYTYAWNSPVVHADSSGLEVDKVFCDRTIDLCHEPTPEWWCSEAPRYCSWVAWFGGSCCNASQLQQAKAHCEKQNLDLCECTTICGHSAFNCKEKKKRKCKLIGSGGCNKKRGLKRCTYSCDDQPSEDFPIPCGPGNWDPPCPGSDGSIVEFA